MTPAQLIPFLCTMIRARKSALITGMPGCGKSDCVAQAAALAGADLMLSHPAVEDPTDSKGMPAIVKGAARFLPFGDLERAINATRPLVWFFDDLGQAPASVQAAKMQLLLAREVAGHRISDHVTFIAATNRRVDRAGVSGILEPVKSRFTSIVELTPDLDAWCQWAIDADLPPELIAFLRFSPALLAAFAPTADLTNSPTPRTWSNAAAILKLSLSPDIQNEALAGAVGEGAAIELLAFLRLYAELPNIDQILIDPNAALLPTTPAALYAIATALAHRTNVGNFARVAVYAQRLIDAGRTEFAVLLIRDALRRHAAIAQTSAFVRLITSPDLASIFGAATR